MVVSSSVYFENRLQCLEQIAGVIYTVMPDPAPQKQHGPGVGRPCPNYIGVIGAPDVDGLAQCASAAL